MPQLDGVGIMAIVSFAGLVVAWIFAPNTTAEAVELETLPAAA
ncbi:MAG: hypothetical protein ACRDGT_05410 [Candidatus Limnocylindria bacterium]